MPLTYATCASLGAIAPMTYLIALAADPAIDGPSPAKLALFAAFIGLSSAVAGTALAFLIESGQEIFSVIQRNSPRRRNSRR